MYIYYKNHLQSELKNIVILKSVKNEDSNDFLSRARWGCLKSKDYTCLEYMPEKC